jgi:hypothetical protein
MLIALLLSQLLGVVGLGGPAYGKKQQEAITDLKGLVAQTVTAPQRNKMAIKTVEAMEREIKEFDGRFNDSAKDISRLVARYDAKRSDLLKNIDQLDRFGDEAIDTLLKQRFQLKHIMTRKEWNTVFKAAHAAPVS